MQTIDAQCLHHTCSNNFIEKVREPGRSATAAESNESRSLMRTNLVHIREHDEELTTAARYLPELSLCSLPCLFCCCPDCVFNVLPSTRLMYTSNKVRCEAMLFQSEKWKKDINVFVRTGK